MSDILVVEDEAIIRTALKRLLERHHYQVEEAGSVSEAVERHDLERFKLIISDLRLPGEPGTELIRRAPNTPVLIMTSYASLRSAVDSMKLGAVDYIAKPFDHDEMVETVQRIIAAGDQRKQQSGATPTPEPAPKATTASTDGGGQDMGIIGACDAMQTLFKRIRKVAPTDSTVLIQGESGTGKVPCSLTRLASCRWRLRRDYCGCCRKERFAGSARCSRTRSMCVWWPPPTATSRPWRDKVCSVRTCITA
jgi:DNA-binding NtrC family response regulator